MICDNDFVIDVDAKITQAKKQLADFEKYKDDVSLLALTATCIELLVAHKQCNQTQSK